MEKELFINAVRMVEIDGSANVPTVVLYRSKGGPVIGNEALAEAGALHEVNEDFKLDLGNFDASSTTNRRLFPIATGFTKSAGEISGDFLNELLKHTRSWLTSQGYTDITRILVAEPLAMQTGTVSADWLANYRQNLKRILLGKGFKDIEFLPEPFAVFQYYRYGIKHPIVAQRRKLHALVIDFGGGTCDVCIIETTKEGDISQSGRISKPLAAASQPIGGFHINRLMVLSLLDRTLPRDKQRLFHKALDAYDRWRKGDEDFSLLSAEYRNFINNFRAAIYRVENSKLGMCRSISHWKLEGDISLKAAISLPRDPFSQDATQINVSFSAGELRELFVQKVWNERLRPLIKQTLSRGKEELNGAPISVVLLSGGSANIGWLPELIKSSFADDLAEADVLQLPDFQEVVSKGLALESARRFYSQEGDFSSVTYNRLCLILDADNTGYEIRPFGALTQGLPEVDIPGVLLPSASALNTFVGKPMKWRVRLKHPPRQHLDYYFLRSSFDPEDFENRQNLEEFRIHSPRDCPFDGSIHVELTIADDGTAIPRFIYREGFQGNRMVAGEGRKFYLDMTSGQCLAQPTAYVGLDFGTSNTSLSFVTHEAVQVYRGRAAERSWVQLSDHVQNLPYPLALQLGRYIGQTEPGRLIETGFEFVEASLGLAAYVAYSEYCSIKGTAQTKLFKSLSQSSAGPLWHFLQDCLAHLGKSAVWSARYRDLLSPELHNALDIEVTNWAQYKHRKIDENKINVLKAVQILANVSGRVFAEFAFGIFQRVQKEKFGNKYRGLFREVHGAPPFSKLYVYEGKESFSEDQLLLIDPERSRALQLQPLMFWDSCLHHIDAAGGHCYMFDSASGNSTKQVFSFKAVGFPCCRRFSESESTEYSGLTAEIESLRSSDPKSPELHDLKFAKALDRS